MLATPFNPDFVRFGIIAMAVVVSLVMQLMKKKAAEQRPAPTQPTQPTLTDALRQAREQAMARRQQFSIRQDAPPRFTMPSPPGQESAFFPSLLLFALVVTVLALVYRAVAG